jgi:phage terminase large subunit-like protein
MTTAEVYMADCLSGEVPAGPWIIKAFDRHKRDLETGAARGLHFDPWYAQHVIDFIEDFCTPAESEKKLKLAPWQHAMLWIVYGWRRADNTRRFRRGYLEIAKKNGKTGLAAALSLYHLVADIDPATGKPEISPRISIAAVNREQAKECFLAAVGMRANSEELSSAIGQAGKGDKAYALSTKAMGRMSCMTRDSKSQDGKIVTAAILDELHRWPNTGGIYSIIRYGGRTRRQPIMWELTTAGASSGGTTPCWLEREYGCKILDGLLEDDEHCAFIFCMDDKDDWKDSTNWVKANPSLGHLFDLARLEHEFHEVQGKPTDLSEFKRFGLNIWSSEHEDPAVNMEDWEACCREPLSGHPDPRRLRKESLKELLGRVCFAGVDLAPKIDTSSLVLLFPPLKTTDKWRILEYFWCPEADVKRRKERDRVPYDVWAQQGFITLTPGDMTDVRAICNQMQQIVKQFDVKEVGYDQAYASELIRMLGEEGFPVEKMVQIPQGPLRLNGPCIEFERKVQRHEFAHDLHPVMRWQMSNLRWSVSKTKDTNLKRPDRGRKREKIDGCSALIVALERAISPDNIIKPKKPFFMVQST